jgi:hypothetical protein
MNIIILHVLLCSNKILKNVINPKVSSWKEWLIVGILEWTGESDIGDMGHPHFSTQPGHSFSIMTNESLLYYVIPVFHYIS